MTEHDKVGAAPGEAIGFLTNGKLTREDFVTYAAIMAIVQLDYPEYY